MMVHSARRRYPPRDPVLYPRLLEKLGSAKACRPDVVSRHGYGN
jgi:hypothetical protein